MVVDGRVGLIQYADIERFGPAGATMKDGSVKQADLIVLATGYEGQAAAARRILGDEVGDDGPDLGFRRGRRAAGHVATHRTERALVPRRRAGPVPHLLKVLA